MTPGNLVVCTRDGKGKSQQPVGVIEPVEGDRHARAARAAREQAVAWLASAAVDR